MNTNDWLVLIVLVLNVAVVVLATLAWHERRRAKLLEQRGDEHWMWAEMHRHEADAARQRLHVMERRYATLQSLYADLVRRRLAWSTQIVAYYTRRKSQR